MLKPKAQLNQLSNAHDAATVKPEPDEAKRGKHSECAATLRDDAATWSAVAWLREQSVANRSRSTDFPDFTKGKWRTTPPIQLHERAAP
ncbi:MAG: hypothetical protein ACKV2V_04680 [Blastocatellia bacterium]